MRVSGQAAVHGSTVPAKAGAQTIADADTGFAALLAAALPEESDISPTSAMVPAGLQTSATKDEDPATKQASSTGDAGAAAITDPVLLALLPNTRSITPPPLQVRPQGDAPVTTERGAAQAVSPSAQPVSATAIDALRGPAPNETPTHHVPTDTALPGRSPVSTTRRDAAELPGIARAETAEVDHASGMAVSNAIHHSAMPTEPNASASALHAPVPVPVCTDQWGQALGKQVLWMAQKDVQSASLTLNPPELGPVRVELQLNDGQAVASFSSAQPEVRKAIEDALPSLKTMFADAGLNLQQADVGSDHAQSRQPQQFQQARNHPAESEGEVSAAGSMGRSTPLVQRQSRGVLDTFA